MSYRVSGSDRTAFPVTERLLQTRDGIVRALAAAIASRICVTIFRREQFARLKPTTQHFLLFMFLAQFARHLASREQPTQFPFVIVVPESEKDSSFRDYLTEDLQQHLNPAVKIVFPDCFFNPHIFPSTWYTHFSSSSGVNCNFESHQSLLDALNQGFPRLADLTGQKQLQVAHWGEFEPSLLRSIQHTESHFSSADVASISSRLNTVFLNHGITGEGATPAESARVAVREDNGSPHQSLGAIADLQHVEMDGRREWVSEIDATLDAQHDDGNIQLAERAVHGMAPNAHIDSTNGSIVLRVAGLIADIEQFLYCLGDANTLAGFPVKSTRIRAVHAVFFGGLSAAKKAEFETRVRRHSTVFGAVQWLRYNVEQPRNIAISNVVGQFRDALADAGNSPDELHAKFQSISAFLKTELAGANASPAFFDSVTVNRGDLTWDNVFAKVRDHQGGDVACLKGVIRDIAGSETALWRHIDEGMQSRNGWEQRFGPHQTPIQPLVSEGGSDGLKPLLGKRAVWEEVSHHSNGSNGNNNNCSNNNNHHSNNNNGYSNNDNKTDERK